MIKTPLSTVIGGAFWTPNATVIGGGQQSFSQLVKKLFANGEQGFFYDPNDLTTMFRDAAGTVPVTAVGQPVGRILDKSGRNNHAFQTNSASRPILRKNAITGANYLEFDGSDDFLRTNNIDFTGTDKVSLFAGVRKLSDATRGMLLELSTTASSRSFRFETSFNTSGSMYYGSTGETPRTSFVVLPAPDSFVATMKSSIGTNIMYLKVNNTLGEPSDSSQGTGNYGNYPLYIGRRGGASLPFNGHVYSLIGIGRLTTDNETAAIEKEIAKRLGVTLNV